MCFDDVRLWLCGLPEGKPSSETELSQEEKRLQEQRRSGTQEELKTLQTLQVDGVKFVAKFSSLLSCQSCYVKSISKMCFTGMLCKQ